MRTTPTKLEFGTFFKGYFQNFRASPLLLYTSPRYFYMRVYLFIVIYCYLFCNAWRLEGSHQFLLAKLVFYSASVGVKHNINSLKILYKSLYPLKIKEESLVENPKPQIKSFMYCMFICEPIFLK